MSIACGSLRPARTRVLKSSELLCCMSVCVDISRVPRVSAWRGASVRGCIGYVGGYKYSSEVLLQVPRLLQPWDGGTERIVVPYWSMYRMT